MSETGVRIRKRDADRAGALARRGLTTLRRLRREGPAVARRWRADMPRLTSRANWARLYGIEQ
jgi:galactofuranosylgalactofuranosylrhamnosyl-N-acetylglucosaminyl-diphospho-decaprenol beta-1,5/1,6-galactofuranosyltransferase